MQFERTFVSRAERVAARLARKLPAIFKNPLLAELDHAFKNCVSKSEFMRFADSLQNRLFAGLISSYKHEAFSKLLALKLTNLAVAQFHYRRRHAVLISNPLQLTVDPTNACQLGCPACVHSSNPDYAKLFDWPRDTLPVEVHQNFLEMLGPFAFANLLYNYGEPLLHKRFSDFVRTSKEYLLFATSSTNLSMPLQDPEGLVASGLDRLVLSIDGTTPETYRRFRKGGNLDLVFENVRKLVSAKQQLGMRSPYLVWQFLTFAHNRHQVADAIDMGRRLGVNEVWVDTPFGVEVDDPGLRAVQVPERGSHVFIEWNGDWCDQDRQKSVDQIAPRVEAEFDRTWQQRLEELAELDEADDEPGGEQGGIGSSAPATCEWLYQNMTLDGASRVLPCCMAPGKSTKRLVFDHLTSDERRTSARFVNSSMAVSSRLAFADRKAYESRRSELPEEKQPFCAECTEKPAPYGLVHVAGDISLLDRHRALPVSVREALTHWGPIA